MIDLLHDKVALQTVHYLGQVNTHLTSLKKTWEIALNKCDLLYMPVSIFISHINSRNNQLSEQMKFSDFFINVWGMLSPLVCDNSDLLCVDVL